MAEHEQMLHAPSPSPVPSTFPVLTCSLWSGEGLPQAPLGGPLRAGIGEPWEQGRKSLRLRAIRSGALYHATWLWFLYFLGIRGT